MSPPIRILIVDDHAILREGIRSLLERQEGIEVVGEAANGEEALERAALLEPDVVLMDVAMPVMDGLEATRRLLSVAQNELAQAQQQEKSMRIK